MKLTHEDLLKNGYKLVFEDHFDGPDVDPDVWEKVDWNCEVGHYGRKIHRNPKNIFTKDSCMVIKGSIDKDENGEKSYNCGIVQVKKFCYKYGYAEARAKIAVAGPGIWMGFWMKSEYEGSKVNSEIDVAEMFGDDSKIYSNIHAWWKDKNYERGHCLTFLESDGDEKIKVLENGKRFSDEFHTFGYFWTPEFVEFTVDGVCHWRVDITNPMLALCHNPIYFIFSMLYGSTYRIPPIEDRTEPIEFCIDYLRLYQDDRGELYDMDSEGIHKR